MEDTTTKSKFTPISSVEEHLSYMLVEVGLIEVRPGCPQTYFVGFPWSALSPSCPVDGAHQLSKRQQPAATTEWPKWQWQGSGQLAGSCQSTLQQMWQKAPAITRSRQ